MTPQFMNSGDVESWALDQHQRVKGSRCKTLVVIITHPEAEPILRMNLPTIERNINGDGDGIRLVSHEGNTDGHLPIGRPPHVEPFKWVGRFIQIVNAFCAPPMASEYSDFLFCEYDVVFVRPLPPHPGGLVSVLAGHRSDGFLGKNFYAGCWWFDQPTAEEFLYRARTMLDIGLTEHGFIDRFVGLMDDLYPLTLKIKPAAFYTRNTILPEHYQECREAFRKGAFGAHGVKDSATLKAITEGLDHGNT